MSKPSGISRNRRKAKCIENNLKVEQKLNNKKKSLNDVFKGFDFSDTSINLNSIDNNFSFKSTKSVLFDKNEENKDINDSNVDSNNSKSFKCLTKSFININENIDKIETNDCNNSIDININRNSFQSLNKSSVVRNEDIINADNSKPNVNKRKNFREIFEDIDLSDFKCDFNNINISFQSSRKAIKLTNDCIESHEKDLIEDKNDSINENLDQFSNEMSELKVSSNSSPKVDNALDATDYSFNTQENDSFLSFAKDFEENSSQTKNTVNESEVNNENNLVNEEIKDEDSDEENSVSFVLRSDYCTFGEKKFDKNEFDSNFEFECFQNNSFMGFRTGSGFQIDVEENNRIKALKIFQDIEICLQREINSIKLNNSMSSQIDVNNTIDSSEEKTKLNTNKEIVSNSSPLNNSNEENLLKKNLESNELQIKETMGSKAMMSLTTSPSDRFKPLKCYPLKQSNKDRILSNSSLFENSIKESMIPCTSTPKSSIHQKPIFEPKKSLLFADNSDDL